MSYLPLARKYRPGKFRDLVGQEALTLALKGAIRLQREPAAVLFSGVRGIGKTTTARIYAKALNCTQAEDSEPCGRCDSCQAIMAGSHEDVIEIDGASHNGVDEVRALKESVQYLPQRSRYKIYIIDEVHMLSVSAFNALLKTLEEPPEQVVFIFATTELKKVPKTIIGRCQTFWLKKMSLRDTEERLKQILKSEGIACDQQILNLIARQGQGSMRDALTCLDQAIAMGGGELRYSALSELLPGRRTVLLPRLMASMIKRDAEACVPLVEQLDQDGLEFRNLAAEMARLARGGFLLQAFAQTGGKGEKQAWLHRELEEDEQQQLATLIPHCRPFDFNRIFRMFIRCQKDMDGGELDRFIFENYCLEWCLDPGLPDTDKILGLLNTAKAPGETLPLSSPAFSGQAAEPQGGHKPSLINQFRNLTGSTGEREQPQPGNRKAIGAESTGKTDPVPEKKKEDQWVESPPMTAAPEGQHRRTTSPELPADWHTLVRAWKKHSLFQAALLEEVIPAHYDRQAIKVLVRPGGLAEAELSKADTELSIRTTLREQFGFQGRFTYQISGTAGAGNDSILEQRQRLRNESESRASKQIREHPLTRSLAKALGSKEILVQLRPPDSDQ